MLKWTKADEVVQEAESHQDTPESWTGGTPVHMTWPEGECVKEAYDGLDGYADQMYGKAQDQGKVS